MTYSFEARYNRVEYDNEMYTLDCFLLPEKKDRVSAYVSQLGLPHIYQFALRC